jgi:hypothetical protein
VLSQAIAACAPASSRIPASITRCGVRLRSDHRIIGIVSANDAPNTAT